VLGSGFQFVRLELIPLVALLTKCPTPPLWALLGMLCQRDTTPSFFLGLPGGGGWIPTTLSHHLQGGLQTVSGRGRWLPNIPAAPCVSRRGW
jgi:hypothetical protein